MVTLSVLMCKNICAKVTTKCHKIIVTFRKVVSQFWTLVQLYKDKDSNLGGGGGGSKEFCLVASLLEKIGGSFPSTKRAG